MRGINFFSRYLLWILFLLIVTPALAQDTTTADGLYEAARKAAFDNKDYPKAIDYSKRALAISPNYTDIKVFVGRIYSWNKEVDSARKYFDAALADKQDYEDAYAAYTDVEYWNDNDSLAMIVINKGLTYHPQSVPLLLRKAKVLEKTRDFKGATIILDSVLRLDNGNAEARALSQRISDHISLNRIGITYEHVYFDKQFPDPWNLVSVDYTRQTKVGSIGGRVTYANRFQKEGVQYEVDAYPRFSRKFYGYLNLGKSGDNDGVFPKWKAGGSLYANLPKAFEAELGIRYLHFTDDLFFYTAYIGKYYKSFLFGARVYLTPQASNVSQTYSAMARYYYGGVDRFIYLDAGWGISPDDRAVNILLNDKPSYKLRTYKGELGWRHAIRTLNIITARVTLFNQQYLVGHVGNQIQFSIGYARRF
ncbi:MAG: YaiO family outer membrane beta-barrel protein [Sphingobacteriales bacterium]|nr:MAG: YaiO family outer membrane beta-barrel protein [Sphingobacteriales bacterium]